MRATWLLPLTVAALVALAGCSDDDPPAASDRGAATVTSATGAPTPASPVTTVPVDTRTPAASDTVVLPCEQSIASVPGVPGGYEAVLGVVALPTATVASTALQTSASGDPDPQARLFAKTGLLARAGASFEIIVPDEARPGFSVGWGSPAVRTSALTAACDGDGWLVFAGGYFVDQVGCRPLLVWAGGEEARVEIGVGAPCAGQDGPPAPTER